MPSKIIATRWRYACVNERESDREFLISIFSVWQAGQPNSYGGNQDCGELVATEGGGEWNDDGCFSEQIWICEA